MNLRKLRDAEETPNERLSLGTQRGSQGNGVGTVTVQKR
jgi:hypothetical protein